VAEILVTGATGFIGSRLIPELVARGHHVHALSRRPLGSALPDGVDVRLGDALDAESLARAMEEVDVVFYLIHSMGKGGDFEEADRRAAQNTAKAAKAAGVQRIIYLGGLGEGLTLSHHLASRAEVAEVLGSTRIPVTTLRAAIILGAGGVSYEMLRYLVERLPVMITPRWVRTRCQPIAVRDVIQYLAACVEDNETAGRTYDIGGPDVLTYLDMMRRFAAVEGKRRLIVQVPVLTPRLSSYWVNLVTPISASIARPLIDGLRNEVVVKDDSIREVIPIRLTPYDEAVMAALVEGVWRRLEPGGVAGIVPEVASEAFALGHRPRQPGVVLEAHSVVVKATPGDVWRQVLGIGGEAGWYYMDWAWTLRGWIDRLIGGVGNRRQRPEDLKPGDDLDTWRVERIEDGRDLVLRSQMRMPKRAILGLHVRPHPRGAVLVQWVEFHPNVFTWLYWWAAYPIHRLVFRGLVRAIGRRAEETARGGPVHVHS
jgi:uncharacterized protein YbjT (DUF2867 family)